MITVGFFNNKGGVGRTSLVYHLAWIYADLGFRVLVVDLDPQANLSALCVDEERLETLWADDDTERLTVYGTVHPVKEEPGDVKPAHVEELDERLALVVGDIRLSPFEATLSDAWRRCLDRHAPSYRAVTAFHRVMREAGREWDADLALINVAPNLGALNRAALVAAEWIVTPVAIDLFSIQSLHNLGPTLAAWRKQWDDRRHRNPDPGLDMPSRTMRPAGYVVMQPLLHAETMARIYKKWLPRIPGEYAQTLPEPPQIAPASVDTDPWCLAVLRHYHSLMAMAHEARKPIFHLQAADGIIGSHATLANVARQDFKALAESLGKKIGLAIPQIGRD